MQSLVKIHQLVLFYHDYKAQKFGTAQRFSLVLHYLLVRYVGKTKLTIVISFNYTL